MIDSALIILLLYRMCGNITNVAVQLLPAQQCKWQLTEHFVAAGHCYFLTS